MNTAHAKRGDKHIPLLHDNTVRQKKKRKPSSVELFLFRFLKSSSYVPHIPFFATARKKNLFSKYMCEMKESTELFLLGGR